MSKATVNRYFPDEVSPPGETLQDLLDEIGMSQSELAERTGRPKKTINEIVNGRAAITPETALQLERVLGTPAAFWNNREAHYREALARKDELQRLQSHLAWLHDTIPVKHLVKQGWIRPSSDRVRQMQEVLTFFGVASPPQWDELWHNKQLAFRQSTAYRIDRGAVYAWIRRGEIEGRAIDCKPFDSGRFRTSLAEIRKLTIEPPEVFQPKLVGTCAAAGVAVTFVPELPGTRACGVTEWLTADRALIQLSLRYKTDDHLWFTFFHEAAHILLHGKRDIFLELGIGTEEAEAEADEFASETLIPSNQLKQFVRSSKGHISKSGIRSFAHALGIAPGIVVGRLQHDGILPRSHCNDLKRRFAFRST